MCDLQKQTHGETWFVRTRDRGVVQAKRKAKGSQTGVGRD